MQALHESSMSGCQGAKIWKFICVAVNELRERSYCFRYKSLLFVKPGLKQKLKKKLHWDNLPRLSFPVVVRRGRYAFDYLYIWKQWSKIINAQYTKKNACLISPFPFTIWSIHSIDKIQQYADRTVHNNCSIPSRHSPFFTIELAVGKWQARCFLATHKLRQPRTIFLRRLKTPGLNSSEGLPYTFWCFAF